MMGRSGLLGGSVMSGGEEHDVPLAVGTSVGGYVIDRLVARGGCGSVYRAHPAGRAEPVAIKVLHPTLAPLPKMIERFVREVELLRRIRHPNIVEIKEVGALSCGTPFFVMEYLPGVTLDVLLSMRGRLGPEEALEILEPVCAALGAAHAAGIVHRDVKASNVMATGGLGGVKLLDFGIAKLVDPGTSSAGLTSVNRQIGTLTIMAPEQLLCAPVDARTDVYALGALLYRLLTGRLPFESSFPGELVRKHLEEPAPRPSERVPVSREIDAVVLKCLEKRPERRYESVHALVRALRHATSAGTLRSSSHQLPRFAVGIFIEIRLRADAEDAPDLFAAEIERILASAEDRMRGAGYTLCTSTSAEVLGLRLLQRDPARWQDERQAALDFALDLHAALASRSGSDPRVHVNVSAHAGEVVVRERIDADPEIVGGPLARTGDWASSEETPNLCATWELLDGLGGFEAAPGPDPLVLVSRSAA
ncbi:protein kinase [Polyangium sp. y55x31]|uniref:serine/threonine protein kinase n=1 Tax=Polyangium sp. y55x31 TaxID=3042688 RepID=UPI00248273D1|nr:protein kinase [Polyangium sp. y55x31]MDI1481445.1 protein kinase [Polyangium sp. y55x31]